LVEVHQRIPHRDEAELLPAAQGGEPYAPSRVFDERRLRAPLTPLPAREATSVRGTAKKEWKKMKRLLTAPTTLYTETGREGPPIEKIRISHPRVY